MSYEAGWAAINLDMPAKVPRTEYSAIYHLDLVNRVTGSHLEPDSEDADKQKGAEDFVKAWDYGMVWSVLTHRQVLEACCTDMGHAEYQAGGTDKRETVSCPFRSPDDVLAFDPSAIYGRRVHRELVSEYDAHYDRQCERFPDTVNMTGVYVTLVSGLIEIFGWEMMLTAMAELVAFGHMTNRYAAWILQYFRALADSKADVVMIHDDIVWTSGPFVAPDWYRQYVFPNYKKLFAPLLEAGKKILYTSDGNYTMFIDDVADCGVHGFVMEPTTDMRFVAETYGRTHAFVGNADTRILLHGTRDEIRAELERCMAIGKDCPGFIMAVGNHIPPNTPLDNALYYNEVYEELSRR